MKFSDVKEKHIYNVVFDPVEQNEFNLTGKKSPTSISGAMNCLFFF